MLFLVLCLIPSRAVFRISFVMKYDECKKVADILFKQFSNFIWIV